MGYGGDQGGAGSGGAGQLPVDKLIEQGLELYGVGDVDGALAAWEMALSRDPEDVRAGAYVDYVRENYELLQAGSRSGEDEVPFGLGAVAGSDDVNDDYAYEVEVTRGEIQARVERYIESVDEGWFLDDELPPSGSAFSDLGPEPDPPPLQLAREHRDSQDPYGRSSRQLPLPAAPQDALDLELGPMEAPGITLELEADEPDSAEPLYEQGGGHHDDEQTGDFGGGAWAKAAALPGDLDFADQRSMVPTREIAAPRGFVRPAKAAAAPGDAGDSDDDRLGTRPGRSPGTDGLDALKIRFTPDALIGMGEFGGGTGTESGRAGPDDRTRESMRLSFTTAPASDSGELAAADGDLGDDDRTIERPSVRVDTASEPTMERGGASYTPAPLDQAYDGDPSGRYPPLVIIEDPVLSPADRGDVVEQTAGGGNFGDELSSPGTVRVRRAQAAPRAASTPSGVSTDELTAQLDAELETAAPAGEAKADRTRRRVTELIDRAVAASGCDDHATAIVALDLALREDPESAVAQKLIHRHQPAILDVYQKFLGDLGNRPALAMPMHELAGEKLDIRAAFLLSRIDGTLSFEEILDVSGMQRPEAFRHLSILLLRGILEVR